MAAATWCNGGAEPSDVAAVVPVGTAVSLLEALAERLESDPTVIDVSFSFFGWSWIGERGGGEMRKTRGR